MLKKKSREELEKDYKDASKKVQDKVGKVAGTIGAASMGLIGNNVGSVLGLKASEKTKSGKKLDKVINKARKNYVASSILKSDKAEEISRKRLKGLEEKAIKRGKTAGKIGAVAGAVGAGALGYKMNNAIIKKQIKKGDEKFLKTATDEQLEKATKDINENFGSKKKKKK